jgi:hypothetical protein
MYLGICESFKSAKNNWVRKSQIRKLQNIHSPRMVNPQTATFAERPQIGKNFVRKFADLRFVELICGLPTYA